LNFNPGLSRNTVRRNHLKTGIRVINVKGDLKNSADAMGKRDAPLKSATKREVKTTA